MSKGRTWWDYDFVEPGYEPCLPSQLYYGDLPERIFDLNLPFALPDDQLDWEHQCALFGED